MKKENKKKNFFSNIWFKLKSFYQKKIIKNKIKFNMSETVTYMIVTFSFGMILGGIIMYGKGPFGSSNSLNEFIAAYNEISTSYYQEVDNDKLLEAGINGMVKYLGDPYAAYMNSEEASSFSEDIEGVYSGIGAEIKYNGDKIVIGRIFSSSPSEKAGLKENDELIKVNGESITGKSLNAIADMVKGEKSTSVKITVLRDGKEKEFNIKRDIVDSISVTSDVIIKDNKRIGYINISIFAANTNSQFKSELVKLEKDGIDSLIIDLRNNQGGYLTTVTDIISLFIKKGDIIYQLKTKEKIETIYDETDDSRNYKVVVLTNSSSASASEVMAAAFKESYHAKIVGTTTFGKGKVQKVAALSNGSLVKYTYQEWLTPLGNYIDGVGIKPDVEVKYVYSEKDTDNQKTKAIEVLLDK